MTDAVDELGRLINTEAIAELAVVDEPVEDTSDQARWLAAEKSWKTQYDPDWKHERIEYKGDYLAVRKPQMQALMALQLSAAKSISSEKQNDVTGMLIDNHFGPESYDRIMQRCMDPDDPDYTTKSVSEIMGALVKIATSEMVADASKEVVSDS